MTEVLTARPARGESGGDPDHLGPIRVVQLVASGSNGGAQEHVASLLSGMDQRRFDIRVISLTDGSSVRRWRRTGASVEVVTAASDSEAVAEVGDRLVAWQTQVLHGHMHRAEVVGTRAALRLQELGLPRPFVVNHVHSSRRRSAQDRATVSSLGGAMDRLVAVSRSIESKLAHERPRRPPVRLIYNGVDARRFSAAQPGAPLAEELGFSGSAPLVGCVARLEPEKGQATLVEAWPRVLEGVPEARLLIVGEGSQGLVLRAQAASLGLVGNAPLADGEAPPPDPRAQIFFTGRRDDIPAVTAALDVSVLPSEREAQGLVVLEAMALSRPVVASAVGGIPEMIEHGVTGLLVPPRDPAALAVAIIRLLRDPTLAGRIGRAGRDLVSRSFTYERMLGQVLSLYEEGAEAWGQRARAMAGIQQPGSRPLSALS